MGLPLSRVALPLAALILTAGLAARAGELPGDAVLADLPFLDHPEPHRVVVDLAPEGNARALRFMVDTGATHNVATPRAAKELGIRVRRHKRDPYRRATVLGRDVQVHVDVRSSDTASRTGWEYALLGGDFLGRYVLELDFRGRRLRFLDPDRFEVPESVDAPGEAVLPLRVRMNRPGVELHLNGEPFVVLIDTGAPPPLIVSGEVAEAAGLPANGLPGFESHGVLGPMRGELRLLDELRVGPFAFPAVPTVVQPHGWYNMGMPGDSVIGYELLAQFSRVRIDYPRRRLWLERDPEARLTFGGRTFERLEDLFEPDATSG